MRRAIVVALILAVLAFAAWRWFESGARARATPAIVADTTSTGVRPVGLWFGAPEGDRLVRETRDLAESPDLHGRVAALVEALDQGPARPEAVAVLPAGTAVLHVYLDDRGLLTLDLSRSFVQGFHGGSTAEWLAVASLVRTIADNLPEVKRVQIVCGGEPVATLGGHVALDRPLDVSEWP